MSGLTPKADNHAGLPPLASLMKFAPGAKLPDHEAWAKALFR